MAEGQDQESRLTRVVNWFKQKGGSRLHEGVRVYRVHALSAEQQQEAQLKRSEWDGDVEKGKSEYSMATLDEIEKMTNRLNMMREKTQMLFHLFPLVDAADPKSAVNIPGYRGNIKPDEVTFANSGSDVQKFLASIPTDVRLGASKDYRAYQIRHDNFNSFEYHMGMTTYLIGFVESLKDNKCFTLPDDPESRTNWGILKGMYEKYFPSGTSNPTV